MSFDESLLPKDAAQYLERVQALPYPKVMERIEREVRAERQPAVGRGTGAILRTLVAGAGGGRILEVGTNLGYSGLWLAAGLRADGRRDSAPRGLELLGLVETFGFDPTRWKVDR